MIIKSQNYEHYNRALGKYISSKHDYEESMKRAGCEPYDPSKVKKAKTNEYRPSEEAKRVARAGAEQMRKYGRVSGSVMKWIVENQNAKPVPREIRNKTQGGMYMSKGGRNV